MKIKDKIESSLTKKEILQCLNEITNTKDKESALFIGQIGDSEFKIRKKPKEYERNAFTPVLVGRIEDTNEGCNINITARVNLFTMIFCTVWSLGAIFVPLIIGIVEPAFLLASLVFATFLTLLLLFAFYKPAKKSIALLSTILKK